MKVPLRIAVVAAFLLVLSTSSSWALLESYLPGNANITFHFTNWDEGTQYAGATAEKLYTHFGEPGYDPLYDLDTLRASLPAASLPKAGKAGEDAWGIFRLDDIFNDDTGELLWSNAWAAGDSRWVTDDFEVTGIFYGVHDQAFISHGTHQEIRGTGLRFGFFEDTARDFTTNPLPAPDGAGLRTGASGESFAKITNGTCIFSGTSVAGPFGSPQAAPYEFYNDYWGLGSENSSGRFVGKVGTVDGRTGALNLLLGDLGGGTNFKFQFDANSAGSGPWLLKSFDPGSAQITPELSSGGLMLLGMLPIGLAWWRRRKA
jgi:hypothetical protein